MDKIKKLLEGRNKYYVIGGIVILVIIIIIIVSLTNNTYAIGDNISINEINDVISNKEDSIIYILNSDSSNKYNKDILNHLNDNNINYSVFDVSKDTNSEYSKILEVFSIDKDLFNVPAIIYIQDGVMFANIINIDSIDVVDTFINDYDLKTITK